VSVPPRTRRSAARALAYAAVLGALAPALACKETPAKRASGERAGPSAPAGPSFRVDTVPPASCSRSAPCAAELKLQALGAFHINRDYPFKFVADPSPGVDHEPDPGFAVIDDQTAAMTLRFRAVTEGTARVLGTFKLSVCSEETCVIEAVPVSIDVPTS
jgi:hypothetical protein